MTTVIVRIKLPPIVAAWSPKGLIDGGQGDDHPWGRHLYTGQLVKERIHFEDRASGPYPSRDLGYLGLLNVPSEIGEVLKAGPVYHWLVTIHPSLGRCHPSHRQERRRHRLGPLRRYMAPLLLHIVTDPRRWSPLPRPCARQVGFPEVRTGSSGPSEAWAGPQEQQSPQSAPSWTVPASGNASVRSR